ncbi:MAG: hypothetical protein R3E97_06725 [Candidatus Eisenbacteria bacterium]
MEGFGIWVGALLTLAIFSFLYRENPIYRFAEHLFVGVSAGYYLVQYCFSALYKKLWVPVVDNGQWLLLGGGVLGALMLFRFHRRTEWISRFAIAFYVAAWSGYVIPSILKAQVLTQVRSTILMPWNTPGLTWWDHLSAALILIGTVSILIYFYFSHEHRGPLKAVSQVGITFLMIGFGASFGYTIMGRITLLIGRFQYLFYDWLKLGSS